MFPAVLVIGNTKVVLDTGPSVEEWMHDKIKRKALEVANELAERDDTVIHRFTVRPRTPLLTWLPFMGHEVDMLFFDMTGEVPLYLGLDGVIYCRYYSDLRGDVCMRLQVEKMNDLRSLHVIYDALEALAQDYVGR